MSGRMEGEQMSGLVRYVELEDAIADLHEWINGMDYDELARQYSDLVSGGVFPIVVRGPCDEESGVWHEGRKMRVVLEPVTA